MNPTTTLRAPSTTSNRWSGLTSSAPKMASTKYVPLSKRPSGSAASSSSSSSNSDASSSRASSPTPSSISSMSSAPSSPRSVASKPSSAVSPASKSNSKLPSAPLPAQSHPFIYTPTHLFAMRPMALESVKERMRNACPEVTMNRRMRKGLEFAAGQARRAARESGASSSSSVSGASSIRGGGSSIAPSSIASSSVAGSIVGSPVPGHRAPVFEEEDEEDEDEEDEYVEPAAPAIHPAAPRRPTTGRRQALPRDLPDNSWRALQRLGVPVIV